jgi:subtilisin family serine protease
MSSRIPVLSLVLAFLATDAALAQEPSTRSHPQADCRLEAAAGKGEGARVVIFPWAGFEPAQVAADLGVRRIRSLDDWADGEADAEALRRLVADPRIRWARPPFLAVPALGDGIPLTGAPVQHALGNQGAGSKICMIDVEGGQWSNAIAAGHIPAGIPTMAFGPNGFDTGGPHGTSCMKVLYEMAPQASFFASLVYYDTDMPLAANWAIANGCHITSGSIAMTMGNYWTQAGDLVQSSTAALVANGILPVYAAGNQAARHQDGTYSDANADGFMDWATHGDSLPVDIGSGWSLLTVTWNAWPQTSIDYDLEVIDSNGTVVMTSNNVQNGTQPPYEVISWNQGSLSGHRLRVKLVNIPPGAPHPQLNIQLWSGASFPSSARKRNGSITLPAAIPDTLAVAALHVSAWPNGNSASYSSFGPCFEDPSLAKPELTAPSAVQDPYYGSFAGTSAACPHVAGAAALYLALEPSLAGIPGALKSFILSYADPGGLSTTDQPFEYGLGRLTLPAVLANGYTGACALAPTTPGPGEAFAINVTGGLPLAPVTIAVDPLALQPLPFGAAAIHVSSPFTFALVDGVGVFGPGGFPALDASGAISLPVARPEPALGLHGVRLQAGWIGPGGGVVTTPAILDG